MHPFHSSDRHWSTADAEIKAGENLELTNGLPLKPGKSKNIDLYARFSQCQKCLYCPHLYIMPAPFNLLLFFFFYTDGCNSKLNKLAIYSDLCFELVWTNCDYMYRPEMTLFG